MDRSLQGHMYIVMRAPWLPIPPPPAPPTSRRPTLSSLPPSRTAPYTARRRLPYRCTSSPPSPGGPRRCRGGGGGGSRGRLPGATSVYGLCTTCGDDVRPAPLSHPGLRAGARSDESLLPPVHLRPIPPPPPPLPGCNSARCSPSATPGPEAGRTPWPGTAGRWPRQPCRRPPPGCGTRGWERRTRGWVVGWVHRVAEPGWLGTDRGHLPGFDYRR